VLGPPEGCVDHHGPGSTDGILDGVFGDAVVVMTPDAAMPNALTFQSEFCCKLLRGIDTMVGAVVLNLNPSGGSFPFKTDLGLDRLGTGETDLVNDGKLGTSGVARDGTAAIFFVW
jgi:hypothetical protein